MKKIVAIFLALGLAVGLGACSNAADQNYSQEKPVSDSNAQIPVSDLGGEEIVSDDKGLDENVESLTDPRDLMPESVKALKAPVPENYPDLGRSDEAGAVALAQYFMDSFLYGLSTADSRVLTDNFDISDCAACDRMVEAIEKNYRNSFFNDHGYPEAAERLQFLGYEDDGRASVYYNFVIKEYTEFTGMEAGQRVPAERVHDVIFLKKNAYSWVINDVIQVPEENVVIHD